MKPITAITPVHHPSPKKRKLTYGKGSITHPPAHAFAHHGSGEDIQIFPVPTIPPGGLTVTHGGGTVLQKPKVQLLFWGNAWQSDPNLSSLASQIYGDCLTIMRGRYLDGMRQYGTGGSGRITGANFVLSNPPNPVTIDDVGNLVWDLIDAGHFPDPHDSPGPNYYCAFTLPGVLRKDHPTATGEHSFADDTDLFDTARIWTGWVGFGDIDRLTKSFSHELVEFCSDPGGDGWQVEPRNDDGPWNEIVDVCAGAAGQLDGVMVEAYYSAQDRSCIIPQNPPPPVPPPQLPNGRYQVNCTVRENRNRYFLAVGGVLPDGRKWHIWEDDAFDRVARGELSFFVSEGGHTTDLIVEVSFFNFRYFKTRGDSTTADNLASLRGCDLEHSTRFV